MNYVLTGSRRLKILASHDSSALLNELRREAAARDREARRQHMLEKRQSYELFLQSLQSWEDSLLEGQQLGAMWEVRFTAGGTTAGSYVGGKQQVELCGR